MRVVLDRYTRNATAEPRLKPYLPSRPTLPTPYPSPTPPGSKSRPKPPLALGFGHQFATLSHQFPPVAPCFCD
jgi:hypothetical protein